MPGELREVYDEAYLDALRTSIVTVLMYGYPSINFTDPEPLYERTYMRAYNGIGENHLEYLVSEASGSLGAYIQRHENRGWVTSCNLVAEFIMDCLPEFKDFGNVLKLFYDEHCHLDVIKDIDEVIQITPTLSSVTVATHVHV